MLTSMTQIAIAVLTDIGNNGNAYRSSELSVGRTELIAILTKLESGNLIRRKDTPSEGLLDSYELTRPCRMITLLDILEATGEHLNCNHPTREEMYSQYRGAANRLGVVNHMTRLYLSEIKLTDL